MEQPTLRLPNGSVITHFQITNNISFPVNYTIDNMTSKLIQTDASKRIQDNLTRFMINYSNMNNIDMNGLFNFNGIMIPPIVIYTFFTRENDFNKINWQPILKRINTNNSNYAALLQRVEHIWNAFIKPFSYWIHNDPVAMDQYRNSKIEIEKAVLEQKDKLSMKLQISLREKYGVNLPLPNHLQAKLNQQMNNMQNNQQQFVGRNNFNGNNNTMMGTSLQTPIPTGNGMTPVNGDKPPPKKRGRKSKKEKEAMLLAQQQQALLNGTPLPESLQPENGPKKKKKPTKKEIEKQKKLVELEIKTQTEFLVRDLAEKKKAIPKVMKPKLIRNYKPLEINMDSTKFNPVNLKELQIVKQLEHLRPRFIPDVSQPLEQSTHTLNSLLMISLNTTPYDTNIVYGFIEDLVKLADSLIVEILEASINKTANSHEISVSISEQEESTKIENTKNDQHLKITVDALTGSQVKTEYDTNVKFEDSKIGPFKKEKQIKNEETLNSIKSSFELINEYKNFFSNHDNLIVKSLQDAFVKNFHDLNKPIITENYLFNVCEDNEYQKIMKLLTIMTIFRNLSIDKANFLALNYSYSSTNNSKIKTNISSFPKLYKLFNTFVSSCFEIILKHTNSLIYAQYMKTWLILTDNIGEVLKLSPNDDYNFDFFNEMLVNLKFFITMRKYPLFEKTTFINKNHVSVGGYVSDILLKMYYTSEQNKRFMESLLIKDAELTNSTMKLLMLDVLNYELIEWPKLSYQDFDFLLPHIIQSLNLVKLIIENKVNEIEKFAEKEDDMEMKKTAFYEDFVLWVNDYGFMNKIALLFQFSYKFFRDLPNKIKDLNRQQIKIVEEEFLKNYQSFLESILTTFNLVYSTLRSYPSKNTQQSMLTFDCNFIRKNIILEMLLSSKFKPLQPKLMILLDNQHKLQHLKV
ncbi:hypothetical protein ACO0R3_002998 [Hanseniaspora guilliermondii]